MCRCCSFRQEEDTGCGVFPGRGGKTKLVPAASRPSPSSPVRARKEARTHAAGKQGLLTSTKKDTARLANSAGFACQVCDPVSCSRTTGNLKIPILRSILFRHHSVVVCRLKKKGEERETDTHTAGIHTTTLPLFYTPAGLGNPRCHPPYFEIRNAVWWI